uniref:Myb-like domain-containing protein n=1 Tax=Romanomermis culicivorax TaxID=13658 RepID=A0A915JIC9_ROMCU
MNSVRTAPECRLFWKNDLLPSLIGSSSEDWTQDELLNLKSIAEDMNCVNWIKIAEALGTGRTAFQCFEQYQISLNDNLIKSSWTVDEEEKLKEVVDQVRVGNYIP